jgi:xanthine dehydrogenase YagS FAD-binding subunit
LKAFTYVNAANEKEAIAALQSAERGKMLPMAGGMDLLGLMKDYIVSPDRVVSIKGLDQTIAAGDGGMKIGAAVKIVDLAEHAVARKLFPALVTAAEGVGTPQIRNMGTVGGNIMQRPRCWYFRNEEFNCLKKGGSRCFAVEGENQFHAILRRRSLPHRASVEPRRSGDRLRRTLPRRRPERRAEIDAGEFFQMPNAESLRRERAAAE